MRIVPFADVSKSDWNEVASNSQDAWMLHRAEWVEIEARFFTGENLSFALTEKERVVGIQPLYLASVTQTGGFERLVHSGIHRHTGLALLPGIGEATVRSAERSAMAQIFRFAEQFDVDRIQLNVHNLAPVCFGPKRPEIPFWVREDGFYLGLNFMGGGYIALPGLASCCADQIVDLTQPTEVLFRRLDESCRRAVRKAERSGLALQVTHSSEVLDTYFELALRSARRTGEALPIFDYYRSLICDFGEEQMAGIAVSLWERRPIAAVFFLADKQSVSFLAGVSDPEHLDKRCNDYIHWYLMLWAKKHGYLHYRLGPFFPEVPAVWPISQVSKFKTKFGADSWTTIQGSFFRYPEHYREAAHAHVELMCKPRGSRAARPPENLVADIEVVAHHLRLFGVSLADSQACVAKALLIIDRPVDADAGRAQAAAAAGRVVLALEPDRTFCAALGIMASQRVNSGPHALTAVHGSSGAWARLRTLHPYRTFDPIDAAPNLEPLVRDTAGRVAWGWQKIGQAGILFIGTQLASDLIRYRQGDPSAVGRELNQEAWGFAFERPMYLFEEQLKGEAPSERHADWWCWALRDALMRKGVPVDPIFPDDAPGVVILTGDDDQAYLANYEAQIGELGPLPITYFLHPLTKHDRDSMSRIFANRRVELGLHPDSLDAPERYRERFAEQAAWFEGLVGRPAASVRNHGFLNDGYWGHAATWLAHGFRVSSNVPGLDGRVLNGSLLPARLMLNGRLVNHWSVLTAIGDGVVFVQDKKDRAAGDVVRELGGQVKRSGVPGAIVLNLHPNNISHTLDMHAAARELVDDGFLAWTLEDLLRWFEQRDAGETPVGRSAQAA